MNRGAYRFALRPAAVDHGYPVLVFDADDRLHLPLTMFAKEARSRVSVSTSLTYLHALLPFFALVDHEVDGGRTDRRWDAPPDDVGRVVEAYLVDQHRCLVRSHRAGFQLVSLTAGTRSTVRIFLSALKLFYRVMQSEGSYAFANPLEDSARLATARAEELVEAEDAPGAPLPTVPFAPHHPRAHRFGPAPYLFQYRQRPLSDLDITACLRFLLHGMVFRTRDGQPVVLKAHLLRHAFAGSGPSPAPRRYGDGHSSIAQGHRIGGHPGGRRGRRASSSSTAGEPAQDVLS